MTSLHREYHFAKNWLRKNGEKLEFFSELPLSLIQRFPGNHMAVSKFYFALAIRNCNSIPISIAITHSGVVFCTVTSLVDRLIGNWCKLDKFFKADGYRPCSWFWVQPGWPVFNPNFDGNHINQTLSIWTTTPTTSCCCEDKESCPLDIYVNQTNPLVMLNFERKEFNYDVPFDMPILSYRGLSVCGSTQFLQQNQFPFVFVEFPFDYSKGISNPFPVSLVAPDIEIAVNGIAYQTRLVTTGEPLVWLLLLNDLVETEEDCRKILSSFVKNPTQFKYDTAPMLCSLQTPCLITISGFDLLQIQVLEDYSIRYTPNRAYTPDLRDIQDLY